MGLEHDDLVEIKIKAKDYHDAMRKVKVVLHRQIDTKVTGLFLNDEYDE
jgi:hypothetical protein